MEGKGGKQVVIEPQKIFPITVSTKFNCVYYL